MNTLYRCLATVVVTGTLTLSGLAATTVAASAESTTSVTAAEGAKRTAIDTAKRIPTRFKNCTNLRQRWPHGVGRRHARDKTSGEPVRNFKRSNRIFKKAMRYNRDLDRDRDKIACERH
ncbi:excalibur calcium-binding domain-containing protein [Mumia zhuanghuii]|uniref:Excalibur calcium-binding domain-containing protein n=1 Tax=Mumia zhuanghuii TaxID=2585211 RepID=A0A5C4MAN2_9ACTN|nr:excalibur calcium-binding domain-containing protein [Mumia zhuanghuii]TNC30582.1 excalibur calcium-binding domain-containing protein [Mumia zhuanghuii]TNC32931.1 excalibur calcium-binding domain-containing protein [Mumia zhuanghuii]